MTIYSLETVKDDGKDENWKLLLSEKLSVNQIAFPVKPETSKL